MTWTASRNHPAPAQRSLAARRAPASRRSRQGKGFPRKGIRRGRQYRHQDTAGHRRGRRDHSPDSDRGEKTERCLARPARQRPSPARRSIRFDQFKSKKEDKRPLARLTFIVDDKIQGHPGRPGPCPGRAIGRHCARTLGNLPGNVCTPAYLADSAQTIAEEHLLECQILERTEMESLGMHSLLSVTKGSHQPPS